MLIPKFVDVSQRLGISRRSGGRGGGGGGGGEVRLSELSCVQSGVCPQVCAGSEC